MNEQEKIRRLTAHFDKLKDVYYNSLASGESCYERCSTLPLIVNEIIIPMFFLDFDLAVKMWFYMLKKYCGNCESGFYSDLSSRLSDKLDEELGYQVLKKYPEFRRYLYSEAQAFIDKNPIYYSLRRGDLNLADELTRLLSENNKCDKSSQQELWDLLRNLHAKIRYRGRVTKEIIAFAEKWAKLLNDQNRRHEVDLVIDSMKFSIEGYEDNDEEDYEDNLNETEDDNADDEYDEESDEELDEEEKEDSKEEPDDGWYSGNNVGTDVEEFSSIFDYNGDGKVDDEDYEFYETFSSMYSEEYDDEE